MAYIQSTSSRVSFEAADHTAEVAEMRDLAGFHEQLLQNSPTYRSKVRQAEQLGPIHVSVSNIHQQAGLAGWNDNRRRHEIDINPVLETTGKRNTRKREQDRKNDARLSLIFEVQNAASLLAYNRLDDKARRGDLSGGAKEYARETERIEFNNMQAVSRIEAQMESKGLECSNKEWPNWNSFEEYYSAAVSSGHAQQYERMYRQLNQATQRRARPSHDEAVGLATMRRGRQLANYPAESSSLGVQRRPGSPSRIPNTPTTVAPQQRPNTPPRIQTQTEKPRSLSPRARR